MPLLENGQIKDDTWLLVQDGDAVPAGDVLLPLSRLAEGFARNTEGRVGVVLAPDEALDGLSDVQDRLQAVQLTLPIFRDGRAFTQARALREHLKFDGIIRVGGHVLPDQYEFLLRCGVTDILVPEDTDVSVWERAHKAFTVAYQPSVQNEAPEGFALRRRLFS